MKQTLLTALAVVLVTSVAQAADTPPMSAGSVARLYTHDALGRLRTPAELREQGSLLSHLDPTRKLTVAEQGRRDLLLRLFFDADATDIPLPDAFDDYPGREVILYDRRRVAAKYLGIHSGHD
jgi:hypothetical protein